MVLPKADAGYVAKMEDILEYTSGLMTLSVLSYVYMRPISS